MFCVPDHGPSKYHFSGSSILSPDEDQRSLFSGRFTACHSQASAGHGIKRGQRIERAVDLWLIAILC